MDGLDSVLNQTDLSSQSAWKSFYKLTKPTIAMLVVVTAAPSMLIASTELPSFTLMIATLFGTLLVAGSAGAFNQIVDIDIDRKMARTQKRPLPLGSLSLEKATIYAALIGVLGFCLLYFLANPLTAWISLSSHLFYVFVYTSFLKKRTVQNIVIGGAAGAVGPLIGWAAVANNLSSLPWLFFLLIFLWTPPHFWALAIKYKDDYAKANIPMLPCVKGVENTRFQILMYSALLVVLHGVFFAYSSISFICSLTMMVFGLVFLFYAGVLYIRKTNKDAMKLFIYSCFYMLLVFAVLLIDQIVLKII